MKISVKRRNRGTATVEFAIVGSVVFLVLFAVMEVARVMHTWGMLNEVSRRAVRMATVCQVEQVLDNTVATAVVNQLGGFLPGFTPENIVIDYLDGASSIPLSNPATTNFNNIRYLRSRIVNYSYQMILPLPVDFSGITPDFASTVRAESLGKTRQGNAICDTAGGVSL